MFSFCVETRVPLDLRVDLSQHPITAPVVALVGPNGSGKTTLLRALAGLPVAQAYPTGAQLIVGERDFSGTPPWVRPLTLVAQHPHLLPHRTILEQTAWIYGQGDPLALPELSRLADDLDLRGVVHKRPGDLSGGQLQRAAIWRALAAHPTILAVDEALSQVDQPTRYMVWQALLEWTGREGHRHLIISSHLFEELAEIADVALVILEGRMTRLDAPQAIRADPQSWDVASLVGYRTLIPEAALGSRWPHPGRHLATILSEASVDPASTNAETYPLRAVVEDGPGGSPVLALRVDNVLGQRRWRAPAGRRVGEAVSVSVGGVPVTL